MRALAAFVHDPVPIDPREDAAVVRAFPAQAECWTRSAYQPSRRAAPFAWCGSIALVATVIAGIALVNVAPTKAAKQRPMIVSMDLLPSPPPPNEPSPPTPATPEQARVAVPVPVPVPVVAPARAPLQPAVAVATAPVPVAVAAPMAAPANVSPPAPPAPPAPPSQVDGDLSSRVLDADPPSYPTESRRRREQGTVRLRVLVGTDGRVADIAIADSSGSDRLDREALRAVKRWRWSPLLRGGWPVMVRGIVTIPFVLRT